jgi:hypothetical protein
MVILQEPAKVAAVIDQAAKTALSKNSTALIAEKLKQ